MGAKDAQKQGDRQADPCDRKARSTQWAEARGKAAADRAETLLRDLEEDIHADHIRRATGIEYSVPSNAGGNDDPSMALTGDTF